MSKEEKEELMFRVIIGEKGRNSPVSKKSINLLDGWFGWVLFGTYTGVQLFES